MAARAQEKQGSFTTATTTSTYSPILEDQPPQQRSGGSGGNHHHVFSNMAEEEVVSSPTWCCCFQFRGGRRRDQESRSLLQQEDGGVDYLAQRDEPSWFVKQLKKLKEFSELVAGPKWKNFIRKFGRYSKPKKFTYMYTPNSYALNFDDTRLDQEEEDDDLAFSFPSRFTAAPLSADKQMPATTSSSL